jgi:hypothetical protein
MRANAVKKGESMKTVSLRLLVVLSLVLVTVLAGACSKTTTVTVASIVPGATVTLPAVTTVLPAATVTLPGGVTTIPATTVTIPVTVTTIAPTTIAPPPTQPSGFLPVTPIDITSHDSIMGALKGDCLVCHGPTLYLQFPMAPSWNGSDFSGQYAGFYYVTAGSIQDHTGRTADICLTCHRVVS